MKLTEGVREILECIKLLENKLQEADNKHRQKVTEMEDKLREMVAAERKKKEDYLLLEEAVKGSRSGLDKSKDGNGGQKEVEADSQG